MCSICSSNCEKRPKSATHSELRAFARKPYKRSVYSWQPIVDTLRNLAFGANDRNAQLLSTIDIGVYVSRERNISRCNESFGLRADTGLVVMFELATVLMAALLR